MQLDFEDVLTSSIGRIIATALFFLSAIWVGSAIGGSARVIGEEVYSYSDIGELMERVLYSPSQLVNLWLVPNVAFLAIMLIYALINDGIGHVTWGVMVGMESLFLMLGWCLDFEDPKESVISWSCWLVLLGMTETGVWLHCQMRRNRWVRAMAELSAENAMLRAQRAAISAAGPDEETDLK
jgi:hypothetical protein